MYRTIYELNWKNPRSKRKIVMGGRRAEVYTFFLEEMKE
jgi:hypothetical protein